MAAFPNTTGTDNFSYNVGMISQQDGGYGQDDDQGYNRGYNPGYLSPFSNIPAGPGSAAYPTTDFTPPSTASTYRPTTSSTHPTSSTYPPSSAYHPSNTYNSPATYSPSDTFPPSSTYISSTPGGGGYHNGSSIGTGQNMKPIPRGKNSPPSAPRDSHGSGCSCVIC